MTDSATTPQPMQTDAHDPRILEDLHIPLCLEAVLDMGTSVSAHAAKARVEQLLEQAKQTDDPVEAMMLEQLCMAHHRIAALHARAAKSTDIKVIEAYSSAAQRLLAEFRRLAIALREYRTPATGKQTTIVHKVEQWNHAEGMQDVSYAKTGGSEGGSRMECRDSELTSNNGQETRNELLKQRERRLEEPEAGRCRPAELVKA